VRAHWAELNDDLHRGKSIDSVREMLDSAAIQVEEARSELQHYLASCENNPVTPGRGRRAPGGDLCAGAQAPDPAEALAEHHAELAAELATLDSSDERLESMATELERSGADYASKAKTLSTERKKAQNASKRPSPPCSASSPWAIANSAGPHRATVGQ
jgi:DNA repair protein RecN (Recombination protein N)